MNYIRKVRPSDLPNKTVRSSDGQSATVKVVHSTSDTLEDDILAAFQSNVRRVRQKQRDTDAAGDRDAT